MNLKEQFEEGWYNALYDFLKSEDFKHIGKTLVAEEKAGKVLTPRFEDMFRAFKECPFHAVNTVILGMD